jgi:predicted nucleotidyltransferase
MVKLPSIYRERADYSQNRLNELSNRIGKIPGISQNKNLTIFIAGSYARHEASKYSDLDLFFLCDKERDDLTKPRTNELRLFAELIDITDSMDFPEFSNDCEFLKILHSPQILKHMGSSAIDKKERSYLNISEQNRGMNTLKITRTPSDTPYLARLFLFILQH